MNHVLSNPAFEQDFDAVVNHYMDFIIQKGIAGKKSTISSLRTDDGGGNDFSDSFGDVEPDMSVEDRYYPTPEYKRLSNAKKLGLKIKRDKREKKGGVKKRGKKVKFSQATKLDKASVKALATAVREQMNLDDAAENEGDSGSETTPQATNRTNRALRRRT